MMKSKINLSTIIAYIQGHIRYKLYYSRFKFLIRKHIRDQIDFRIKYMDKECYEKGSCKLCGCATTALQMADKQCDKPCYPPIFNKSGWAAFNNRWMLCNPDFFWGYFPGENECLTKTNAIGDKITVRIYPQNNPTNELEAK